MLRTIFKAVSTKPITARTIATPTPILSQASKMVAASNTIISPPFLHQTATHQLCAHSTQTADPTYHLRILESIKEDHREITSCGEHILQSNDADEQTRAQNMFTWELARHTVAEELVVYPAMERYLGGGWGREVAEKDRQEHQKV